MIAARHEVGATEQVDGAGHVLLVRKADTRFFMQAGGKIEPGEEPAAALVRELHEEIHRLAGGLVRHGLLKGRRVLLMVPAGAEFITLTFALFKTGAVPVLIDPGLGRL